MQAAGLIHGVVGSIKWSYFTAAQIEGYTVIRSDTNEWSMSARVVMADAFKLAQRPLVFVAPTQHGDLRWPITSITKTNDGHLSAALGPPLP